ncbi:hypothetical protein RMATCC62417_17873 [Rhizopus microsporus]|nr:hypothetical protein RMATCC62417_17873 [Rhizopus microsporus]
MKQRFNALDVRSTVMNLKERLIGIRLQNVYDVNAKTFLFKFAKPDDKELVLVESGTRIHTTQFSREKSDMPSPFCAKLRKCLRTRRLTNVRQLGVDRIVDFEFAGGEKSLGYHIICEFYASGNIILTDHEYRILALLRTVQPTETLKMAVGETYNIKSVLTDFKKVDSNELKEALSAAGPKDNLKKILNIKFEYGPAMVEHIIMESELDPNMKVASDFDTSENSPMMHALLEGFKKADDMIQSTKNAVPKGYIILMDDKRSSDDKEDAMEIYDEFHPFLYKQFTHRKFKEYPTFDMAVDEFFSSIEAQKLELKTRKQEEAALKKLEAVKQEQEKRVETLLNQQLTNTRKAELIELNLQYVDAAITIIRNAVASQMDWQDLNDLVKEEKRRGNPIALLIDTLKLETNQITLVLTDPDYHEESENEDEEEKPKETFKVDVDIGLTAFANARKYYEQKKSTASKHEKTIVASTKALKSAERKIRQDLKETKITATINKIRKPFWFEKFQWFISTEGYLVIAGRDMQQNEMLVKRYLSKDDVYVHADLHGAASVVVKNKPQANGQPISPSTLYQAGIMSVCQSKAWDSKIVTSAYWVYPDQVSKSAPTGEYLTTGSFMIRGKKNFLPPVQLVYGFGYLFKLDESSIGNHIKPAKENDLSTEYDDDVLEPEQSAKVDSIEETDKSDIAEKPKETEPNASSDISISNSEKSVNEEDSSSDDDDSDDSSSSSSSDDESAFPDTKLQSLPVSNHENIPDASKYALDEYGHDSDEDQTSSAPDSEKAQAKKRFITAKERRLMKKQNATEITEEIRLKQQKQQQKQQNNGKQKQQTPAKPNVTTPPSSTRGRKGKAKKIKEKYADQDEEERQLRMELLGSNKGPQPKGKKAKREAKAKAEKAALEKERARKEAEEKARLAQSQKEEEKENDEPLEAGEEKDTDVIRQLLKEENITMLEADEIANLSALDSLTGNPLPEDILHFAIPVCAPYPAIQKYKYKVKLTPGSLKRGKVKVSAPNLETSKRKKGSGRK